MTAKRAYWRSPLDSIYGWRSGVSGHPKTYFCKCCWGQWHDAIVGKAPWVTYCINEEHQQRRQAIRDADLIYLGDEFEIGEFDGEYRLAPTEEHFQEWD